MATVTRKRKLPDSYYNLVGEFPLTSITSDEELAAASAMLDKVLALESDVGTEAYLDALTDLVEVYEQENCEIPEASEAEVLQHLLEARKLSQAELAKKVTIAASTISAVLNGVRSLTKGQILKLAEFFGVSPQVFLVGRRG
jgi:HTH-type transcriptional regulator/antitoxin HigA